MSCMHCSPELAPTGPPRGGGHFGVRFGTMHALLSVFKDDEQICDCYEVDVDAGKAWRFRQPPQLCACGNGAEAYLDTGAFSVATLGTSV